MVIIMHLSIHLLLFCCGNSRFSKLMKRRCLFLNLNLILLTFCRVCLFVDRRRGGQRGAFWAGCWRVRLGRSSAEKACLTLASTAITCWAPGESVSVSL